MKDQADNVTAEMIEPAVSRPEGLTLVYMTQVKTKPQVRTETGWDDESLEKLGESIQANGLLQLPLLREDKESLGYVVIAGHRRIEAMRRKGFESFYAIVGDANDEAAHIMQLTENIHREQLSTRETAYALRSIADRGTTLGQIATMVNKSKPWVSKHLAVTHPEFGKHAKRLFISGEVEDLEVLNMVNQIEKLKGDMWVTMNQPETWTRKSAKKLLDQAKREEAEGEMEDLEKTETDQNDNSTSNDEAESSEEQKVTAKAIQDAMVSLISHIKEGNEYDGGLALAYIIGHACGKKEADNLSGTMHALAAMLK